MPDLFGIEDEKLPSPPPGGDWTYLRIAVERGLDQGGTGAGLTYKAAVPVAIGRRVEVPLGRGNKLAAGIVIAAGGAELLDGFSAAKVKSITRDTGAGLPPRLVELARWMSGYYVCPLGMVLAAMLPAAVKKRTGLRTIIRLDWADPAAEQTAARCQAYDRESKAPGSKSTALGRAATCRSHAMNSPPESAPARSPGSIVSSGSACLREVESEDVRQSGGVETQTSLEQADPLGGASLLPKSARPDLTPAPARIVDGIGATLAGFGVHLVRGVTGSGKTEVYLRILERVLASGKTGLILVPEISLTPQTAGRFVERFRAAGVGVLHSGLSASQRHREWARAASGAARVMVGARSAFFSPLENIGLIVVDEEHASDYKQDQLPRYHGRDVAIKRAQMEACPIILGAATPSLESWANTAPGAGRFAPATIVRPKSAASTPSGSSTNASAAGASLASRSLTSPRSGGFASERPAARTPTSTSSAQLSSTPSAKPFTRAARSCSC